MPERRIALTIIGGPDGVAGKQVILYGDAAKRLVHLARIDADLQAAESRCEMYLTEEAKEDPDVAMLGAFSEAAFIAYARGKDGAGGSYPPEIISTLSENAKAVHDWALGVRDKYAGHSVNALNQTVVVGAIQSEQDGSQLAGLFAVNSRAILGQEDVEDLLRQAGEMRRLLAPLIEAARLAVFAEIGPSAADSVNNPSMQFDLIQRDAFDYLGTRGPHVRGRIEIPAVFEIRAYGE